MRTGEQGTFGQLCGHGLTLSTVELPWRENRSNVSCIPAGEYQCSIVRSPRFGRVFHVRDVPGRSAILIHAGNFAGDEKRGWRTNSYGCILPGLRAGRLGSQEAVLCSRAAVSELLWALDEKPFTLVIQENFA